MKIIEIRILIALFLLDIICGSLNLKSQKMLGSIEEEALEFDAFKTVRFNTNNKKYFKFTYEEDELMNVLIYIRRKGDKVRATDSNGNSFDMEEYKDYDYYDDYYYYDDDYYDNEDDYYYQRFDKHLFSFNVTSPGVYILEFYNPEPSNPFAVDNEFTMILPGQIIDTIDLSQKMYYNSIGFYTLKETEPCVYEVKGLTKNTYVYFSYGDYSSKYNEYGSPIEICSLTKCNKNIKLFQFKSGTDYSIKIHFAKGSEFYYYLPFIFFPINENTIQLLEKGLYKSAEPKIYNFYLEDDFSGLLNLNCKYFHIATSDIKIQQDNIDKLKDLTFRGGKENLVLNEKSKYYIFVTIPPITTNDFMDDSTRVVIFDDGIFDLAQVNNQKLIIPSEKSWIIYINSKWNSYPNLNDYEAPSYIKTYNRLTTYSSSEKNLHYVMSNKTEEYFDFLIENSYKNPIYMKKASNNVTLTVETFYPKYAFFGIMTKELYKSYLSFFLRNHWNKRDNSDKAEVIIEPELYLPINIRVNSDLNGFYDYFNFYLKDFEENVNVYINKLYGETEFFECSDDDIDMKDLSFLTKPITNCKNKKSVFNRLFSFKGSKIVSGYLSPNSYFDIYVEYNDDDHIIKIPSVSENTVNSASKYIRKDIEYKVDFNVEHMVKIEPKSGVEVSIYNKGKTIKLNSDNPNAEIEGKNFFVKTNVDTMIYFYGKLNSYLKQIKIDPSQKGKNIKIISYNYKKIYYCIDTGFEGYNPLNLEMANKIRIDIDEPLYIENIYEKIKNKLVNNENLYFYYANGKVNEVRINLQYINETLNNPNNDYTFVIIPKNSQNKGLVLNNRGNKNIIMGVQYCKKKTQVKIYSKRGGYSYWDEVEEEVTIFNSNETEYEIEYREKYFNKYGISFRFESSEDFIFTYSYFDETDQRYPYKLSEETEILNNLTIENIIDNSQDNIITIKFKPNYVNLTTKYIIIITSEEGDNIIENFKNPCYIAKLATDKPAGVKIKNFFNVVEDNETIITAQVDISDIINNNNEKYIVNIISQELRLYKKLNFYKPETFEHKLSVEDINMGENKEFDLSSNKAYFNIKLSEAPKENKMLLLHYILDSVNPITININSPNNKEESFNINNKEGFINFLYDKSGDYKILFKKTETEKLRNSNSAIKGTFEIDSTDKPFSLKLNEEEIEFNEFTINTEKMPSIIFNVDKLDKTYTKKFLISNYDYTNINKIVSIKKDDQQYKELEFNYYTFEKDSKYEVTIKFHQNDDNYVLEKVNILDYSSLKAEDIFSNTKNFDDTEDKFYIINWKKIEKIIITKISRNPVFLLSDITESQSNNLIKELQNIKFKKLDNLEITKSENDYSVLMIELDEIGTELNIEVTRNNNNDDEEHQVEPDDHGDDDDDDDDDDDNKIYIIVICILGGIILIILVFLIIRCMQKNKRNINFEKETKGITNEKLLQDI